ncbi:DUF305 domain-containing protein [Streptomyces sp. NBC_01198]|uniref:DUF305 domain-containing protein n=1 Tax=Streptomyces sp. NBC_01198 TaxID=2903769 RepID=UPI002E0DE250|nr:DUF305 domain-containing protein [Streptomyces sp. NBC_01198]
MRAPSVAAALLAATLVAGCSAEAASVPAPQGATSAVPSATGTGGARQLDPTDLAWAQLLKPMDEQVMAMVQLAPSHAAAPAVRQLAQRISPDVAAELASLDGLLRSAGQDPAVNVHEGHHMPGMMTVDELTSLGESQGAAFDRLFLRRLRDHGEQAARLAALEGQAGSDPASRALARTIAAARAGQLAALTKAGG